MERSGIRHLWKTSCSSVLTLMPGLISYRRELQEELQGARPADLRIGAGKRIRGPSPSPRPDQIPMFSGPDTHASRTRCPRNRTRYPRRSRGHLVRPLVTLWITQSPSMRSPLVLRDRARFSLRARIADGQRPPRLRFDFALGGTVCAFVESGGTAVRDGTRSRTVKVLSVFPKPVSTTSTLECFRA